MLHDSLYVQPLLRSLLNLRRAPLLLQQLQYVRLHLLNISNRLLPITPRRTTQSAHHYPDKVFLYKESTCRNRTTNAIKCIDNMDISWVEMDIQMMFAEWQIVIWTYLTWVLSKAKFCMNNEIITYISGGLMSYLKAQRGNSSSWSTDL